MDIKKLRKAMLYTQQELADILNVSLCTIQNWESGKKPSYRYTRKIIEFCKANNILIEDIKK